MKKKKQKNKCDKWFLLTWKKILIIIVGWFLAVILHNLFYALSEMSGKNLAIGEVFFFLIAVIVIPIYVLISFVYTAIKMIKDKSIFEKEFIIKFLIAIIFGAIATLLVIKFNFINPEMGFVLTVIFIMFTFIFYSLVKLIKKRR